MPLALRYLLQRAAAISKPYSCQDATLIIKALGSLRLNRPEVRLTCEKACFSLASSPHEVPAAVIVDVVHHLCAAQAGNLPVAQKVLARRFCELSCLPGTNVHPRTAHKAALALIKLGRAGVADDVVEHVLRLLHTLLMVHPSDAALREGYIALYSYSARYSAQPQWWRLPPPQKPSIVTLASSIAFVLRQPDLYRRARGNRAWLLLHVLLVLPPSIDVTGAQHGLSPKQILEFEGYVRSGALASATSAGAYAAWLQAFGADISSQNLGRMCMLLEGLFQRNTEGRLTLAEASPLPGSRVQTAPPVLRRMNVYDLTKVSTVVAEVLAGLTAAQFTQAADAEFGKNGRSSLPSMHGAHDGGVASLIATAGGGRDTKAVTDDAVRLCAAILSAVVASKEGGVSSHGADWDTAAAHGDATSPPSALDGVLVAALLQAYAKAFHFTFVRHTSQGSVVALLRSVPCLTDTSPQLLSWLFGSLASLSSAAALRAGEPLAKATTFVLQCYVRSLARGRAVRGDVAMLHGCARLAVAYTLDMSKAKEADVRLQPGQGKEWSSAAHDSEEEYDDEWWADVDPPGGEAMPFLQDTLTQLGSGMTALLGAMEQRFDQRELSTGPTLSSADVRMLLIALLDMHRAMRQGFLSGSDEAAEVDATVTAEALRGFQDGVLSCLEREPAESFTSVEDAALLAVRLHLLLTFTEGERLQKRSATAERVLPLLHRCTDCLYTAAAVMPSAVMLRCLTHLQEESSAHAASVSRALVCSALCTAYQRFLDAVDEAGVTEATIDGIVRVAYEASRAGIDVSITDEDSEVMGSVPRGTVLDDASQHRGLLVPLCLLRDDRLTLRAAATLLQLVAESHSRHRSFVLRHQPYLEGVATTLTRGLTQTPDVRCMVRLLWATESMSLATALFPSNAALLELARCVEVVLGSLLADLAAAPTAEEHQEMRLQLQARRLLTAVAKSQLFFQTRLSVLDEFGAFRAQLLELAATVEKLQRRSDQASILKIQLLCGGAC